MPIDIFSIGLNKSLEERLKNKPVHLCIGIFDGVHKGHQVLLNQAIKGAKDTSGHTVGVYTFYPHPSRILSCEPKLMVMPDFLKHRHLEDLGIHFVVKQIFDRAFSEIKAEDFLSYLQFVFGNLHAIYIGQNFRFGHKREGDVSLFKSLAQKEGIEVLSTPILEDEKGPISSSGIRAYLQKGQILEASNLLGYPYYAQGQALRRVSKLFLNWSTEISLPIKQYTVYLPQFDLMTKAYYEASGLSIDISKLNYNSMPLLFNDIKAIFSSN